MAKRTALFLIGFVLPFGGCAYQHQAIYNVDRSLPPAAEHMSVDKIRDIVVAAGTHYEWIMQPVAPGHLEASERKEKYAATADIYFNQTRLTIALKSSANLNQTATTIHGHYNVWIRNLENRIVSDISAAGDRPR